MRRLVIVALLLAGCMTETGGPPSPDGFTPACTERHGLYREHLVETDGTCGAVPDLVVNTDDPLPAGCSFTAETTDNGCHTVATVTCVMESGITTTTTGTFTFTPDGSHGAGTVYLRLSGASACASTYAATFDAVR